MSNNYKALSAEKRIERASVQIMRHEKFIALSGILMVGETTVVEKGDRRSPMNSAATNGKDKFYTRDFVMQLDEQELNGLVIHEAKHVMYQHLIIWQRLYKIDGMLANMAADYVINLEIQEADPQGTFAKLPKGGCVSKRFTGMDTQQVFKSLQKTKEEQQKRKEQGKDPQSWEDKKDGIPDLTKGGGQPGQPGDGDGSGMDFHDWADAQGMTKEEKQELSAAIDQAIRQGAILAGKMGGNIDRAMIEAMKAKIDWREALREFLVTSCDNKDQSTWRRPNRRWIQHDIYMPTQEGEAVGELVFAIDTSGSISDEFLGTFLGELASICETVQPERVHVIYWDAAVAGHEVYERDELGNLISSTRPKGGGGTAPSCVTQFMKEKKITPLAAVIATDGYVGSDWGGTWPCPTLWVVKGNPGATASNGMTLHVE